MSFGTAHGARSFNGRSGLTPLQGVLLFVAISLLKTPEVLIPGRLWAEDGVVWFNTMQAQDLIGAATYVYRGTIQLLTALVSWVATRAPLALVPYLMTLGAFAVQVLVAAQLVMWGRDHSIRTPALLAVLSAWALLPATYEVWATPTNMQWTCSVSVLITVLMAPERLGRHPVAWLSWIGLCGLTGVPSSMLAPAFAARAVASRRATHLAAAAVLGACALIQLWVLRNAGSAGRSFDFAPVVMLTATLIQTVIVPVASISLTQPALEWARGSQGWTILPLLGCLSVLAAAVVAAPLATFARRRDLWLSGALILGMWGLVSALNLFGSLGDIAIYISAWTGLRYFLVGSVCLCLLLATAASRPGLAGKISAVWLGLICLSGVADRILGDWMKPFLHGPAWAPQIEACAAGAACNIAIWPTTARPGNWPWFVHIPARVRGPQAVDH